MEQIIVTDKNDVIIQLDDKVIWTDPETKNQVEYQVWEVRDDMVKLSSEYGECEALPEECEVIWDNDKLDRWIEYCADGETFQLLDEGGFPFTKNELGAIRWAENDSDMSDSDFCDYILKVAQNHIRFASLEKQNQLKRLGKYLVEQGFKPEHVIDVFHQSDEYYQPIMHIDLSLEKAIADFCDMEKIEFTEFLGSFTVEDLF